MEFTPLLGMLKMQNQVLLALAISQRKSQASFKQDVQTILKVAAEFLKVRRASVWLYRKNQSILECISLYDLEDNIYTNGLSIKDTDYPQYFSACKDSLFIAASNAVEDYRTIEFASDYLPLHGISSMLDVPIFLGSHPKGILCLEHVGPERSWQEEEQRFASSIADLIGLEIAERDRDESLQLIESGFNTVAQGIIICNSKGHIVRVNTKTSIIFGYLEKDLLQFSIDEIFPGCMDKEQGVVARVLKGNDSLDHLLTGEGINRLGNKFPVEYSIAGLANWREQHALIIFSDISERIEKEALIQRKEMLYRSVVEDQTDLIIRVAPGGVLRFANQVTCKYFNIDMDRDREYNIFEFVPEDNHQIIYSALGRLNIENPVTNYSHEVILPNNNVAKIAWTLRAFYLDGKVSGYQAIGRDVTDEEGRQERERESQKMQSLAVLAGGMAHDFNNLLTPILSFTDLTQINLPPDSSEYANLQYVMQAATRARELTRMVLIFSKREEARLRSPIFAGRFIREIMTFIKSTTPSRIIISENIDTDSEVITANPSDLYQILSNLCTNAAHAMPAGGVLSINSSIVLRKDIYQLQIEVSDTGVGIPKDKMRLIFDPFFTSKPVGQGTGLGLSVVKSIVEDLGGQIECKSEEGKGTSFVIYLPTQEMQPAPIIENDYKTVLTGSETILVVDDEPFVACAIRDVLDNLGYKVVMRTSANEAISVFVEQTDHFDAVITDYTMPYMTGLELSWNLRRSQPTIPIILMSGYGGVLGEGEIQSAGLSAIIEKPFNIEEIASVLRKVLNSQIEK